MCWSDKQVGHQSEGSDWDPNAKINPQKSLPGHRIIVKPKYEILLAPHPTVSEQKGGEPELCHVLNSDCPMPGCWQLCPCMGAGCCSKKTKRIG